jgi:hypothetical protein
MVDVPAYAWVLIVAGMTATVGLTSYALYRGAKLAGAGRWSALRLAIVSAALLGGWLAVTGVLADHGAYLAGHGRVPWLAVAFAGALAAMLGATQLPLVARALSAPGTLSRLELPHMSRVIGAAFLIMLALGHLPALFAVPAGVGDIASALAAPFVYRRLKRGPTRRGVLLFNAFGLLDLVTALTLAILTLLHVLTVTPSTQAITQLPLAFIPTGIVPLLFVLHVTSVRQVLAAGRAKDSAPGAVTARLSLQ